MWTIFLSQEDSRKFPQILPLACKPFGDPGTLFSYNVALFACKSHIVLKKSCLYSFFQMHCIELRWRRKRPERTPAAMCNVCSWENYVSIQSVTDVWKFVATTPMLPMSEHWPRLRCVALTKLNEYTLQCNYAFAHEFDAPSTQKSAKLFDEKVLEWSKCYVMVLLWQRICIAMQWMEWQRNYWNEYTLQCNGWNYAFAH